MSKESRSIERIEARREARWPSKAEILETQGMKYVTFVVPIVPFNLWADHLATTGKRPTERVWELITKDMKGEIV